MGFVAVPGNQGPKQVAVGPDQHQIPRSVAAEPTSTPYRGGQVWDKVSNTSFHRGKGTSSMEAGVPLEPSDAGSPSPGEPTVPEAGASSSQGGAAGGGSGSSVSSGAGKTGASAALDGTAAGTAEASVGANVPARRAVSTACRRRSRAAVLVSSSGEHRHSRAVSISTRREAPLRAAVPAFFAAPPGSGAGQADHIPPPPGASAPARQGPRSPALRAGARFSVSSNCGKNQSARCTAAPYPWRRCAAGPARSAPSPVAAPDGGG